MKYKIFSRKILRFIFIALCLSTHLHAFPFNIEQIKEYVNKKFTEAQIEFDPFPHLVISQIFPPDVYDYLVSQWPEEEVFDRNSGGA